MTTPRTRRVTRPPVDAAPDTNAPTKIKPLDGTVAEVTEQVGAKTVTYQAEITQDEDIELEDEDGEFDSNGESNYSHQDQANYQEIPKDPLTFMFDAVREAQT